MEVNKTHMESEEPPKTNEKNETDQGEETRETWGNQCEFFLYCLGYAVGFGNVWRFPYLVYKNGGAAFLIPYITMLFCAGLPLFFMEFSLGQYVSIGPNALFPNLAPIATGLGWAMVAVSFLVTIYYNIILAWSFFYTFASFTDVLPWGSCSNDYNSPGCYTLEGGLDCRNQSLYYYNDTCISVEEHCGIMDFDVHNETTCTNGSNFISADRIVHRISPSEDYFKNRVLGVNGRDWNNMGSLRWELVGCNALAWLVVGLCMARGIQGTGKVVYFTALFPYVVLIILFVRGITLPGSEKGIEFYVGNTDWTRLSDIEVWNDAATQIFYSLGISFGSLITLASYNKFNNNCMRDAMIISICNCCTSIFAGFVIFSILGFLATELDVDVSDVVNSGSGLVFIVYPAAVERMPLPQLWSVMFFIMFLTLGLGSQFSQVEAITTALYDQFKPLRKRKPLVVLVTCSVMFILGLTMLLEGGMLMFELFQLQSAGLSVIVLAITETVLVQYIYGHRKYLGHIRKEMSIYMPRVLQYYWSATWCVITPLSLGTIFVFSIYFTTPAQWDGYIYPTNIQVLGWFMVAAPIAVLIVFALFAIYKLKSKGLFKATPDFCPAHERTRRRTSGISRSTGAPNQVANASNAAANSGPAGAISTIAVGSNEGFKGYVPYVVGDTNYSKGEMATHM